LLHSAIKISYPADRCQLTRQPGKLPEADNTSCCGRSLCSWMDGIFYEYCSCVSDQ
jgi:hypothetical protein